MPSGNPKKTLPCEGCRERKKKCSGTYPCVRCQRLDIKCVYLRPTLPPDHAYVNLLQEQELAVQVDTLESTMVSMEKLLNQLRHANQGVIQQRTLRNEAYPSTITNNNDQQPSFNWQIILGKQGVTINTNIRSYADLLEQIQVWQRTCHSLATPTLIRSPSPFSPKEMTLRRQLPLWLLRRGHFIAITTCVMVQRSKSDSTLCESLPTPPLPTLLHKHLDHHHHHHHERQLSSNRYDHQHQQYQDEIFLSPPLSTSSTSSFSSSQSSTITTAIDSEILTDQLSRNILDTFFDCYLVRNIFLHRSTFYHLFVDTSTSSILNDGYVNHPSSLFDSPVICAVCAVALTVRCRHMLPLIPYQEHATMANRYFCHARDLVCFDEPTLESFITLTFLALYKQLTYCVDEASFYLDLAFRTRCILFGGNKDNNHLYNEVLQSTTGDDKLRRGLDEMIKRLHWALWEVYTSLEYYSNLRGVPKSTKTSSVSITRKDHPIARLMQGRKTDYIRHPLPDEPAIIQRSIQHAYYQTEMMATQGSFLRHVRFGNKDTIDLKYLAETEYRFNQFYQHLPTDYRMDPNLLLEYNRLFDDGTFREKLNVIWNTGVRSGEDTIMDDTKVAALNMTIQYYQGIISMYEPFLPDLCDRRRAQKAGLLKDDGDTPSIDGSMTTTDGSTSITTDNDDIVIEPTPHERLAQEKCTDAATMIVKLLDYQRSLSNHCAVNIHILLTAWDIHMRNACIGMTLPPLTSTVSNDEKIYFGCLTLSSIHQARQYLLQCLSILREGYLFNFAEHAMWRYYEHLEHQLLYSMMTSPPSAAFWIPFGI
ncbi:uncharacterized protein BX664DRAFT_356906 [Halteromyces radiatus]|uniref:uncharacterized protein n=1 Tax=Halteromyces radiatus TaxID=101107 RepID=UPI002220DBAF|nr:uncharacterized protein BX664DRAFT_356906 [Halteromyces radiatus]KAI8097687.1 hypothetical protein BX664DRAFT_356906 [Halteromyces radiatus]